MKKLLSYLGNDLVKIGLGAALFAAALITEHSEYSTVSLVLYILSLVACGHEVFADAIRGIFRRDLFDEKFLMCIGAVGALVIGKASEGCAVMLFYLVGEYFEHMAVKRSRASIKTLMDICPDEATVLRAGEEITVDASEVAVGDIVIIRAGERVPVDCTVIKGNADVNNAAITGEAIPRAAAAGSLLESGSVVLDGVLTAKTERTADNSAASRILELVETASENKAREEYFITKFAKYYTPTVVILAVLVATVPAIFGWLALSESVYRALVFLVFSCPCALVISVPMSFFGGIGCAASRGILYKGGNVMGPLARAKIFAFDKTGTLTTGSFTVSDITAVGVEEDELLRLAATAEYGSNHPIAECIKAAAKNAEVPDSIREIAGKGIIAELRTDEIAVGNKALMSDLSLKTPEESGAKTHIYVSLNGKLIGIIGIADTVKSEAKDALLELKELGVSRTVMLTGDIQAGASAVADAVGISEVHSGLLPQDKYEHLRKLIAEGHGTVYVGDGINDAPSLTLADVGIAMGALGSDSAIESADVVIMSDTLDRLPEAVKIARRTLSIAKQNIIFALSVKAVVLVLGALGFANMWLAVFADVGVAMIAILNAMRALIYKPKSKL